MDSALGRPCRPLLKVTIVSQRHPPILEGHLCTSVTPFIHSLTQSFNKYLSSVRYVPGTVPSARNVAKGSRPPCQGTSFPRLDWAPPPGPVSPDTKEAKSQANWIRI